MNWKELTKTFMMISNLVSMVYTEIFQRCKSYNKPKLHDPLSILARPHAARIDVDRNSTGGNPSGLVMVLTIVDGRWSVVITLRHPQVIGFFY